MAKKKATKKAVENVENVEAVEAVNENNTVTENQATEAQPVVEEVQVTFSDKNGNAITFDISINTLDHALEMHANFGDKPAGEHKGFYTHLAHKFFQDVQNSGTPVEEAK